MKDGSDGFLTRWARRKAAVQAEEAERADQPAQMPADALPDGEGLAEPTKDGAFAAEPEFDLTKLPSIESLTKDSDVTMFMQRGVPAPLKQAALHKVWTTDPAIRDYIGLSEMSWDFNAPEAFPGYGALSPLAKVAEMVNNIANPPAPNIPEISVEELEASESTVTLTQDETIARECAGNEAPEGTSIDQKVTETRPSTARHRHGGAIPR